MLTEGAAAPNTGIPGVIAGYGKERVIHAPAAGILQNKSKIGDLVEKGQTIAMIGDVPVTATLTGVLRGLIRDGQKALKSPTLTQEKVNRKIVIPFPIKRGALPAACWKEF